jgi:hypothetical protein
MPWLKGILFAINDGLMRNALFRGILQVLLDIANLRLKLAEILLNVTFCFQRLVSHELGGSFFDASFYLFDAAFNLVFVDTHDTLLKTRRQATGAPTSKSWQFQVWK